MNHRIEELIDRADLSDEAAATAHELVALSGHQYSHLRAMTAMYTPGADEPLRRFFRR